MNTDTDDSVGVKMLADHLVQVKNQYEGIIEYSIDWCVEQINQLTQKMQQLENEKYQLEREFKQMQRELDDKRLEIFNMKRANVAQHAIEERENWNAILIQQKTQNKRLENGTL